MLTPVWRGGGITEPTWHKITSLTQLYMHVAQTYFNSLCEPLALCAKYLLPNEQVTYVFWGTYVLNEDITRIGGSIWLTGEWATTWATRWQEGHGWPLD